MKQYESDRTCLKILRITALTVSAVLICLSIYFLSFIPILMISLNVLFLAAGLFAALVYLPVYFKNLCYSLNQDREIIKKSGFFFITEQIMSIDSIQFTTSISTPFKKLPGFNFFILYAYGGVMTVMFLSSNDFDDLRFRLRK